MTPEEREEQAMDMVIRLATTINAYEEVAFTSKSTNMGTYVYEKLDAIPEEFRPRLMDELSDVGLVNCWYIAGLLYKVKFQEREAGGALDISSDLEDYQERLDATVEQAAVSGADFSLDESVDDDDYADDEEGRAAKARRAAALVASAAPRLITERIFSGCVWSRPPPRCARTRTRRVRCRRCPFGCS